MKNSPFFKQAELMLRILPIVSRQECFALKGGTAINLFVRDMPRLSVDIDLTYSPLEPRDVSLKKIEQALKHIATDIKRAIPNTKVQEKYVKKPTRLSKLMVTQNGILVKIEPNEVLRGHVFDCQSRDLSKSAEKLFEMTVRTKTIALADLYGGKICAALDRQHPRDIFDVKLLMEIEGITDDIRKAFVVYLACHDRPMNELLNPNRKDFKQSFNTEFVGITDTTVDLKELLDVREKLIKIINNDLTHQERQFLLSIKSGEPEWRLLGLDGIERLPAIQWKLLNVKKMDGKKHKDAVGKLKAVLEI